MNTLLIILLIVGLAVCFAAAYVFAVISVSLGIAEAATYAAKDIEAAYKKQKKEA